MSAPSTHETRRPSFWRRALLVGLILVSGSPPAHAVTNSALGGIGGLDNGTLAGGDGTGSARVSFDVTDLGLVKQARDVAGRVLPDGSNVAAGQEIVFLLYVDNPTLYPTDTLQIADLMNEAEFTYVPHSLETATMPSGSDDAAMWSATWTPVTDAVGSTPDDLASFVDTGGPPGLDRLTIGNVPGQSNRVTRLAAQTRLAVRFRVRVN